MHLALELRVLNSASDLVSLFVETSLVQGLPVKDDVLLHVRVENGQLLVAIGCVDKVLHIEVGVAQQRESRSRLKNGQISFHNINKRIA